MKCRMKLMVFVEEDFEFPMNLISMLLWKPTLYGVNWNTP